MFYERVQLRDQNSHQGSVYRSGKSALQQTRTLLCGAVGVASGRPSPDKQVGALGCGPVLGQGSVPNRHCLPLILPEAVPHQHATPKTLSKSKHP